MNDDEPLVLPSPNAINVLAAARFIVANAASNAGTSFGGYRNA